MPDESFEKNAKTMQQAFIDWPVPDSKYFSS